MAPPVAAADGIARVAARRAARISMSERGLVTRARRMVAAGHSAASASEHAATQGKGYVAETDLAASFAARSGLLGSTASAYPNPNASHPTDDIILTQSGHKAGAVQVKNGLPGYVQRHIESGKYPSIVANREAVAHLEKIGVVADGQIPSCIEYAGIRSIDFSAEATHKEAKDLLVAALEKSPHSDRIMALASAARSGRTDSVVNFGLSVAFQTVEDLLAGKPLDVMSIVGEAAKAGAKAFVRTTVVTYSQAVILLRRAKSAFSSRLIRAITSSTLVMSAVADVVVEFAVDFVAVIRGEMDGETLLRNLGVNTCGAIGSLAGAGIALAVARGAPWLLLLLAIAAGLWIGREAGRLFGGHIFGEANTGREAHESV
jgi:hypothetical protein